MIEYINGNPVRDSQPPQGAHTLADGSLYWGEMNKDGLAHGQGVRTLVDGTRLEGTFRNGWLHGQGTMTLPSGARYEGEFANNLPHGQGAFTLPDGSRLAGEFRNGEWAATDG